MSGPSLSVEHRAELIAGLVQVLALVIALFVVVEAFQRLGIERGSYLLGTALAAGNLVALLASRAS
jgi:Co/Zn/Cd efflux system component